jgi:hypothetical protein
MRKKELQLNSEDTIHLYHDSNMEFSPLHASSGNQNLSKTGGIEKQRERAIKRLLWARKEQGNVKEVVKAKRSRKMKSRALFPSQLQFHLKFRISMISHCAEFSAIPSSF